MPVTRRTILLFILAAATACSKVSSTRINGPDGSPNWHRIECRGGLNGCVEEAGRVCPAGYRGEHMGKLEPVYFTNFNGSTAQAAQAGDSIVVRCNDPGAGE